MNPEDCYAILSEPRRPWLDVDALKQRFLTLSSPLHPDRIHGASEQEKEEATRQYAAFNAAFNTLREPKERLPHLIQLETGAAPRDIQRIPPGTMDLFVEIGQLCRDVDAFLVEKGKVTSPLLKVQIFVRGQEWTQKLNGLQQTIHAKRDMLNQELRDMNSAWEKAPESPSDARLAALPLERLEQIYRVFSYITRWTEQIQSRIVELAV